MDKEHLKKLAKTSSLQLASIITVIDGVNAVH